MSTRYASVDAFRGLTVAAMLLVNDPGDWEHVWWPLEHAAWNGCTPTDLIFPWFLFIVGMSIALAFGARIDAGVAKAPMQRTVLIRAARIVALGVALNVIGWLCVPDAHLRFPGVLQRIGVCFAMAGTIALYVPARMQWALIAALLVGYAALLFAGGTLDPFVNIVSRSDFAIFGRFVYLIDPATGRGHDPEGLLGTLPSVATVLLGMRAGDWLRRGDRRAMAIAGLLCVVLGYAWSYVLPLNKNLWTPSFVLWTAGWGFLVMLLAHELVDRRGWPALGRSFGVNAITVYGGSDLMIYLLVLIGWWTPIYVHGFAAWITPLAGATVASHAFAIVFVAIWWGIARWLDHRRIYIKL